MAVKFYEFGDFFKEVVVLPIGFCLLGTGLPAKLLFFYSFDSQVDAQPTVVNMLRF